MIAEKMRIATLGRDSRSPRPSTPKVFSVFCRTPSRSPMGSLRLGDGIASEALRFGSAK